MKVVARLVVARDCRLGRRCSRVWPRLMPALDNELSVVDGKGRTLDIQQWDTFLNGVFPLDRNRLTREWFHSGRAIYHVTGPGCRPVRRHVGAGVSDRVPVVAGCRGELQLHHAEHQPGPVESRRRRDRDGQSRRRWR